MDIAFISFKKPHEGINKPRILESWLFVSPLRQRNLGLQQRSPLSEIRAAASPKSAVSDVQPCLWQYGSLGETTHGHHGARYGQ